MITMKPTHILPGVLALSIAAAFPVARAEQVLSPVVVTAPPSTAPLTVETDPKAPRQPIPAHDGADFLKSIPGFSVIRKGGTDGDPVLRGLSGSRLGILIDGQEVYGGCGSRMDPPTAYVYPESFDRVVVLKGPQSVLYGAGQSAGVVMFERDYKRFDGFTWRANGSLTAGSYGRNDQVGDVTIGNEAFYVRAGGTRADSGNYQDGDGRTIHSRYTRWSSYAAFGLTPDDNTRIELSANLSDGKAAYADRAMDGSKFRKENISLLFEKRHISDLIDKVEARIYHNHVDHVMDNYSLRPNAGTMMSYAAMNPDRTTEGGRVSVTLTPSATWRTTIGTDTKYDVHRYRNAMMKGSPQAAIDAYSALPYQKDAQYRQIGLFGESTWDLSAAERLISGLRIDWHTATDRRLDGYNAATSPVNSTRDVTENTTLYSGFVRYEKDRNNDQGTSYIGLGHVERTPDYWERLHKSPVDNRSAFFTTRPEKTTQLDIGTSYRAGNTDLSVSAFYGKVQDYILLNWDAGQTRNVNATIMGGEIDAAYQVTQRIKVASALSYVYGKNDTDGKALAQQPPLELRLSGTYDAGSYSFGALWRLVAPQNRFDIGSGNIVSNGKDLGRTGGFGTLSLNAGWVATRTLLVTAGIDNVFNKTYAEHLSRAGQSSGMTGTKLFPTDTRINEPGRTFWVKAQVAFK
jgi:iron complex outermembrane receptor protein